METKQIGKLAEIKEPHDRIGAIVEAIDEVALDFAGPFQNAKKGKIHLLVSIDHFSGWPDAKLLHRPTTKKVIKFLKQYCAQYGVSKTIRKDPGTVFISEAITQFCEHFGTKHITCPMKDQRGNGKIERFIRTISERFRENKHKTATGDKSFIR